ncbi:hypothetical protein [Kitasatospora sp. NPDC059571]|uniref:hypothetical protein n=1 Tax=Kitasatospora sp. NPDC059571 TaxID=3346871 RepID=UPI0036B87878
MRVAPTLRAAAVAALLTAGAMSAATAPAAAADSTLTVVGAVIVAQDPDSIDVTVSLTCTEGDPAHLFIAALQSTEDSAAAAGPSVTKFVCTGTAQQMTVRLTSDIAGNSWKAGPVGLEAMLAATDVVETRAMPVLA